MYDRANFEKNLLPLVQKENLAVMSYYSLASGFLTGKYRRPEDASKSVRGAAVIEQYLNKRGLRILAALDLIAKRYSATLSQVALAWTIKQPGITAPIASASNLNQLKDILFAAQLHLDNEAIEELTIASQP